MNLAVSFIQTSPHPPRVYTLRTNWTLLTALIFTHTACRSLEVVLIFPDYSISLKCEWICKLETRLSNENFIIKGCNDPLPLPLFIFLSSSSSFSSLSIFFVLLLISMFYKFLRIGTTRIILFKGSIPFLFQISYVFHTEWPENFITWTIGINILCDMGGAWPLYFSLENLFFSDSFAVGKVNIFLNKLTGFCHLAH